MVLIFIFNAFIIEFTCSASKSDYQGEDISFLCTINGVNNIDIITIDNGMVAKAAVSVPKQPISTLVFEGFNAIVDINLDIDSLLVKFLNVSCSMQGTYEVKVNNDSSILQMLSLEILSKTSHSTQIWLQY